MLALKPFVATWSQALRMVVYSARDTHTHRASKRAAPDHRAQSPPATTHHDASRPLASRPVSRHHILHDLRRAGCNHVR
eukprot:7376148-Prymnesium_polylepis.1